MANTALDALAGEEILESNSLGTVMKHCVLLRAADTQSEAVISLDVISSVKTIKITFPGLLVIAGSAFLIAAAAAASKEGGGAAGPTALLGSLFLLAYWLARKASVALVVGADVTETAQSSVSEASAFAKAVRSAIEKKRTGI
ncbi:MAG: hypothetical protein JO340_18585 [Acidobacteriaceae bacterium]|nr:hypothetical protein [Acidobacteriaceae bacterium]